MEEGERFVGPFFYHKGCQEFIESGGALRKVQHRRRIFIRRFQNSQILSQISFMRRFPDNTTQVSFPPLSSPSWGFLLLAEVPRRRGFPAQDSAMYSLVLQVAPAAACGIAAAAAKAEMTQLQVSCVHANSESAADHQGGVLMGRQMLLTTTLHLIWVDATMMPWLAALHWSCKTVGTPNCIWHCSAVALQWAVFLGHDK